MNLKLQRFFGWLLIIVGLFIIGWALYSSFNIFTAKTSPPQLFTLEKSQTSEEERASLTQKEQMEQLVNEQLKELVPMGTINLLLNLVAWLFFAALLIFSGSQIALLGIKLIK
ncbi:MAG TPA: hypothetical protein ENL27_00810 [Candidatus Parcubacteria bacterium]|nr:hypothetical protein [Candidatus Parcubacteria bacterium]